MDGNLRDDDVLCRGAGLFLPQEKHGQSRCLPLAQSRPLADGKPLAALRRHRLTRVFWVAATFLTKPEHDATLRILCNFHGCLTVWGALFGIGGLLSGK